MHHRQRHQKAIGIHHTPLGLDRQATQTSNERQIADPGTLWCQFSNQPQSQKRVMSPGPPGPGSRRWNGMRHRNQLYSIPLPLQTPPHPPLWMALFDLPNAYPSSRRQRQGPSGMSGVSGWAGEAGKRSPRRGRIGVGVGLAVELIFLSPAESDRLRCSGWRCGHWLDGVFT